MPSRAAIKAVADVLGDPQNEDLSAEEVAERAIEAYEEAQASTHNLIVLGHFRLEDDTSYVAAVGPLPTRATARAREVGERFAWDYKTRRGTGKFVLVPLIRNPSEGWDKVRADCRPPAEIQEAFIEAPYYVTGKPYEKVPACICGVKSVREELFTCLRHPEGRGNGEGPA